MIEIKTIIQVMHYLIKKNGHLPMPKIKLVKLIYLADKYHLLKYGRTITNDIYFAMPQGPVGSTVLNLLNLRNTEFTRNEYKYASIFIKEVDKNKFIVTNKMIELDALSETDKEVLDYISDCFGHMKTWDLVDFTHKYPEWAKYKKLFDTQQTRREPITNEELLTTIPEDHFKISKEHIKESRAIIREEKCL